VKNKGKQQQTPSIVEDGTLEGLKKRARDIGLIVNAGQKPADIELLTRTTRRLDPKVRCNAERKMGGGKKGGNR
jgi:hypothetical protein